MDRDWRIRTLGRDIRLVRHRTATPPDVAARLPAPVLRRLLRAWLTTVEASKARSLLYELLCETARIPPLPSRTALGWFVARVEQRIDAGDLIGVPVARPVGYGVRKTEPAAAPPPEPVKEEPETLAWIEIELVDVYGEPVPNEAYSLELPDGVVKSGKLDSAGLARLEGIPPGTCKVTFPGFDGREWRPA